ncbi:MULTISPECIES: lipoprotein-releasing ABC transporter permease subunit [unclassified Pseudomonas]|uniref:lipoprotein-releasing ABC transporter permease subunit n=1 Tax=unclassified Pseudomonas TaxID=196821 RepID=UPI002AC99617|nr:MULTISPECIES: lipoprotein-releasing ABC transporter permease subunit [unclassified Pseudomonas]MEB0040904.1 lipoprotein-releasing ABC transporter permease subunit [Pseudomonas sp. MH10]MEB0078882.1 lipoprotein-releasing ABC transporter permease subunit [Pseudomonas sp. MH10out]MEB0090036.1 lipoprotein-releasing ABC transporter permease subunit [Pseudomonas sp. CCI4.2]MEB0102054.1 lipoprotein-releasing ABC transporter permease subunit [Pseudomonas sp. CCI3.2]MEB0120952.1 lipoprotein-releasin
MFRPLSIFIGTRYTRAKRRNHFISFISMTSMIGLALGVLAMIVVLSVMNGFQREMSSRILGMVPHAVINGVTPLDNWKPVAAAALKNPEVTAAVPFTEMDGMFSYKGSMQPIQVSGVDPALEHEVSIVAQHITQGRLEDLKAGEFGVVVGEITARRFRLNVGDKVTLIVPEASATAAGGITPRLQRLTVVGVFKVGAELDGTMALINVADAAQIQHWQPNQVQGVRLALKDLYTAPQVSASIVAGLGADYRADDWTHTQGSLFSAMKMEKTMIGLLLLMIVAVAAFNIIATLIMVVNDKGADIAILRTIGATPGQIMTIFMVQGTVIGIVGTLIGGVLGVIAAINVSAMVGWLERVSGQHIFSSDVYFVNNLPSQLQGGDVVLICSAGFILSFLATLYPAWRAAQIQPAYALRYE